MLHFLSKTLLFYFIICLLATVNTNAQLHYNQFPEFIKANSNWVFGKNAGLWVDGQNYTAFQSSIEADEGCAAVSDPVTGELLFYSNGLKCWDRNGNVMPNGDSLYGGTPYIPDFSSTFQNACIVPVIDSPGKFYLFTLQPQGSTDPYLQSINLKLSSGALYYSVIDMRLNNGLGDVVRGRKNIFLDSALSEGMIAVLGNRCKEIWLLVHRVDTPLFKAFHITSAGVNHNPVVSVAGTQINRMGSYFTGGMAVSPNREWLAVTSSYYERKSSNYFAPVDVPGITGTLLCRFNAFTGEVSGGLLVNGDAGYGLCFSPDNTKLYVSRHFKYDPYVEPALFQYDIRYTSSSAVIQASETLITYLNDVTQLKLYNDKIYGVSNIAGNNSQTGYLSVMDSPNLSGAACNYRDSVIPLTFATTGWLGMTGEVVYPNGPASSAFLALDTTICYEGEPPQLELKAPEGYQFYQWSNGSTGNVISTDESGTYWVRATNVCQTHTDTFKLRISPALSISLGGDTTLCEMTSLLLNAYLPGADYLWQDGSTAERLEVRSSGKYWVELQKAGCSASDTVRVSITDFSIDLGADTSLCEGRPWQLDLRTSLPPEARITWSTGSFSPAIRIRDTGRYRVRAEMYPCFAEDSIAVTTEMCDCIIRVPNAFSPNGDGLNDVFRPSLEPGCTVRAYSMQVFNRWGALVYSSPTGTSGYKGWDGRFDDGSPAATGVYYYLITLEAGSEGVPHIRKGDLMLLR